jgi:hypothetical protein
MALSKCNPNPSTPATMPTPRNNNNAGMPNRLPALPTNTLKNSKQAMMSIILFAEISIKKYLDLVILPLAGSPSPQNFA